MHRPTLLFTTLLAPQIRSGMQNMLTFAAMSRQPKPNKPKIFHGFVKNTSLNLMSLIFSGLIILGGIYVYVTVNLPDVHQLKDIHLQVPLQVYTNDGKLIAEFGEKKRIPVTLTQVPPLLLKAILATEDQRYYEHKGVDFFGLMRAAVAVLHSGKKVQGASTITMQVARNFFFSPEKTYRRKINEILLAFKIDKSFSKNEILELYINTIYLGQRAYGVAAAAQIYFGKKLQDLTLSEIATIAGLPQAPSRNNPITNFAAAKDRRDHVLQRMLENKDIDETTYKIALAEPINASYHGERGEIEAPYLAEMARNAMYAQFGDAAYEDGYKVYTTIDSHLQNAANNTLRKGIVSYEERHGYRGAERHLSNVGKRTAQLSLIQELDDIPTIGDLAPAIILSPSSSSIKAILKNGETISIQPPGFSWARQAPDMLKIGDVIRIRQDNKDQWHLAQLPKVQGALVAMNPKNGAILALNGGFSYVQSSFNRAIQADRQAGSSFKPFIYSAALDKNLTLATVVNDAPIVINIPGTKTAWRPQNNTQRFYGPTRLRVALIQSINLVSVRLLQMIGVPYAATYVKRFGFDDSEIPATPALALGTAEISPLKLAAGYAVFANGGYKITPFFINSILDRDNKSIFTAQPASVPASGNSSTETNPKNLEAPRAITEQNAYLITNALKDVIYFGTGKRALVLNRSDLAGKTGTTNDQVDAWFAGFNTDLVATVWIGYDQPQTLSELGSQAALPIWIDFISIALAGKPERNLSQPFGITTVRIDPHTGLLAYPGQKDAIFEVFTDTTVPTERSSVENYANAADSPYATSSANSNDPENDSSPLF